jgi:hypothetical protein
VQWGAKILKIIVSAKLKIEFFDEMPGWVLIISPCRPGRLTRLIFYALTLTQGFALCYLL